MVHEAALAASRASRRAVALVVLGIACLTAAAAVPAAMAVPAAWEPAAAAAPRALVSRAIPVEPGEEATAPDDALPRGPGHPGGTSWRPSLDVEPRSTAADGPETVARMSRSRVFLLPGAPLEGVLHGLAPPDRPTPA